MIESINQAGGAGGGGTVDTIQAGTGISVDATNPASPIITNTSPNTDETAKVSSNDTTAGYLNGKLVAGTNITLTENNNGGNETLTIAAAGGVTGFTGSQNTASPNNTVNASRLLVDATSTNADFVAQPKGTGALLANLPNGVSSGGNKRGANAVDLQLVRNINTQVASGVSSALVGGQNNTASNSYSGAFVGYNQVVSGPNAVCLGGNTNTVSGDNAVGLGGNNSVISGLNAAALGGNSHTVTGENAIVVGGNFNTASAAYSVAFGYGSSANRFGMITHGHAFAAAGDAQREEYVLRRQTTDATATELTCDGAAGGAANRMSIATDSAYAFSALIVGRATAANDNSAGYKIEGVIDNNAGTTAFVGTPTVTVLGEDTAAWDVVAEADNTNDALVIKVTGAAATTIRWVASVRLVKVTG